MQCRACSHLRRFPLKDRAELTSAEFINPMRDRLVESHLSKSERWVARQRPSLLVGRFANAQANYNELLPKQQEVYMFGNPLWKLLEGPLKSLLKDKFSVLSGRFKALLSSTQNDLITAIESNFPSTGVSSHLTYAELTRRSDDRKIQVHLFPADALAQSPTIKSSLMETLKKNVDLNAARVAAGINDEDWKKILQTYSGDVLRFGLPYAIETMSGSNKKPFSMGYHVIDLARGEAIKIQKRDVYKDVVVLYRQTGMTPPTVSEAKSFWKKRKDTTYRYERAEAGYDGFTAG
jgi:hypothetical protein